MSATVSNNTKDTKKGGLPPEATLPAQAEARKASGPDADGFVTVEIDRPMFKAELFLSKKPGELVERYEGPICQGHVLGHVEMPAALDNETGELRPWGAYVIQLTQPSKGVDRGVVVDKLPGDILLVADTTQLTQAIPIEAANHPTMMAHVKIEPISRSPMPDDAKKKMWKTVVKIHPTLVSRKSSLSGNAVFAGMLASAKTAQLAAG